MKLDKIIKVKRSDILRIAAKHGAYNVRVFGSFSRGESGSTSDLDLLVDVKTDCSPFFPGGLIADLENLLDINVDVVTEKALHWYIRKDVLKESIAL